MPTETYHLAQVNIARLKAPLTDPLLADFVANLDPVNAVADAAPGFVWRLVSADNNATDLRIYGDEWLIVNMSVWTSVATLTSYVYAPEHRAVLSRRREWFERLAEAVTALWWVPAGHVPDVAEAERRLTLLRELGPTPEAFSLRTTFPPPSGPADAAVVPQDLATCDA